MVLYRGGDGILRRSRYDGGYALNILGGREWTIGGKNLLGVNLKCTFMGPFWHQPVDEAASGLAKDVIYDHDMPYTYRNSNLETANDFSIYYRINHEVSASVITLQVKNFIGRQYMGKKYNLVTGEIENDFFLIPIPFLSYKLEF